MHDEIIKALLDWNPWFEGPFPQQLLGYRRDYNVLPLLDVPEIKIIEGARRVGKSTILLQVINHVLSNKAKVLYINFDDEELAKYSLKDIYHAYLRSGEIDHLFLDEIQNCPEWVHFVRKLYDQKTIKQIWISGSNSSLIKQEYKKLITGRNFSLHIHPLSFREFLRFKNIENISLPFSSTKEVEVLKHFDQYLKLGAFPAIALRDVYQKELLINYFEDIVYKDIVTRHEVNPRKAKELGIYLATNCAKNYSFRSISATLGIHPKTATDYFSYFNEVFMFSDLYKFDYSLKNQFGSERKVYAIDSGLAAAISFRFSEDKGRTLENLVFNELKRRNLEIYFHKQKKECDFLVKQELAIISAIQVTYSLTDPETRQREFAGLEDAMNYFSLPEGVILTMHEEGEETLQGKKIIIKPVWKWMLEAS